MSAQPTREELLEQVQALSLRVEALEGMTLEEELAAIAGRVGVLEERPDDWLVPNSASIEVSGATGLGGGWVSVASFGGSTTSNPAINGIAINKAIAALGAVGGVVYFPERGVYRWSGVLNAKEKTNVRFVGQGGITGGGGIGLGAPYQAGTSLQCESTPAGELRAVDARSSIGVRFEHIYLYNNSKPLGEAGGVFIDWSGSDYPGFFEAGYENTGVGEIIGGVTGIYLAASNGGSFKVGRISGFEYGVLGRVAAGVLSVAHQFSDVWFVGQQKGHVLNPNESWKFSDCVWEQLRNLKGESTTNGAIKLINNTFLIRGLRIEGGWMSTTPAAETGEAIELVGSDIQIVGLNLGCAETAISFIGKVDGFLFRGDLGKVKTGLFLPPAAKGSTDVVWEPTIVEAVTTSVLGQANAEAGSIFKPKAPTVQAWGALVAAQVAPGAFKKGAQGFETEAEAKAVIEKLEALTTAVNSIRTILRNKGFAE